VIDGEIVVADTARNILDFEALQQRIHPAASRVNLLAEQTPASFIAFDLLALGGDDLTEQPLERRRALLEECLADAKPPVHVTPVTRDLDTARRWFEMFEGAGLDGLIAKPLDLTYQPDKRVMAKIKHERTADCVVAGYRVHKSGPDAIGSLLLGLFDDRGVLASVGVVGAFPMAVRRELMVELAPLVTTFEAHGDIPAALAAVRAAEDAADIDYALGHTPTALASALDGLGRVAAIVRAMKDFAHPDRDEKTLVDLNRAIESTLMIAAHEYKYVADVRTELAALPDVRCNGGEINQAVLNLVINAAHAIRDVVGESGGRGRIVVRTRPLDGEVEIAVSDTGTGIPDAIRDKVYDPFFTTKDVGRGTGQGLAIARNVVVDKHGGSLRFESELGVGTTFFLRLPIGDAAP